MGSDPKGIDFSGKGMVQRHVSKNSLQEEADLQVDYCGKKNKRSPGRVHWKVDGQKKM